MHFPKEGLRAWSVRDAKDGKVMGKHRQRLLLILCIVIAAIAAGCGKREDGSDSRLVLGFSQIGSESAWRIGNTKDIEEQAAEYGIGLMLENANQKQENQIAAIRRFIAYQVDVIAFPR